MNREEIIKMAVESYLTDPMPASYAMTENALVHLVETAMAAEREACAKLCEVKVARPGDYGGRFGGYGNFMGEQTGPECAAAIRARGEA